MNLDFGGRGDDFDRRQGFSSRGGGGFPARGGRGGRGQFNNSRGQDRGASRGENNFLLHFHLQY